MSSMSRTGKAVDRSYAGATNRLAAAHRSRDKGIVAIWSFPDPKQRELRLVEVTKSVPFNGSLLPFGFDPQEDIPFRTVVILAHPEEWARVEAKKLRLPKGWNIDTKQPA